MYGNTYFGSKPRFRGGLSNPNIGGYYSQYNRDYQKLYNRLTAPRSSGISSITSGYIGQGANPVSARGGVPADANQYFQRATSEFVPRTIDPEAAIRAAIDPIEARRNEQFSAVQHRLGKLGGMGGTPQALGLGRVAQQSAMDIASATQDRLMQAAMDNARRELEAEQMRRQHEITAGRSLLDFTTQDYDRDLRAQMANQDAALRAGETLGRFELQREGNLAGLAGQLAGLHASGAEADLGRGWQSWENEMDRNWRSDEAKRAWLYENNIDPDDPWAWQYEDPWNYGWGRNRGFFANTSRWR